MPPNGRVALQIKTFKIMKVDVNEDFTVPKGYQFLDVIQGEEGKRLGFYVWLLKLPEQVKWDDRRKEARGTTGDPRTLEMPSTGDTPATSPQSPTNVPPPIPPAEPPPSVERS